MVDRKSTSTYVFKMGSDVISWTNKEQTRTELSLIKVEYNAIVGVACEAIWFR
jgi:hypothetical protein